MFFNIYTTNLSMTSVPQNMNSVHDSGAKPTVEPSTAPKNSSSTTGASESYPEQKHAGKVGLGPNYHAGATLEDKVKGLKEELKGKFTHKPELVEHGRELISGEERRKKLTGEDEPNPFQKTDEDKDKSEVESPDDHTHGTDDKSHLPAEPVPRDDKSHSKVSTGPSGPVDASTHSQSQSRQTDLGSQNLPRPSGPVDASTHSQSQSRQMADLGSQNLPRPSDPVDASTHSQSQSRQTDLGSQNLPRPYDPVDASTHSQSQSRQTDLGSQNLPRPSGPVDTSTHSQSQSRQTGLGSQNLPHSNVPVSDHTQSQMGGKNTNNPFMNSTQNQFPEGQTDHLDTSHMQFSPNSQSQIHDSGARQGIDYNPSTYERANEKPSSQLFQSESDADPASNMQAKANPFGMAVNGGHGKGAMEQAATIAPEGTYAADKQRRGNDVDFMADAPRSRQ